MKLQAFKFDLDRNNKFIVNSKMTFRHLDRLPLKHSSGKVKTTMLQSIPVYPDPYIELHIFGLLKQKRFEMIFLFEQQR